MPHIGDDWTRGRRTPRHGSYALSAPPLPSGAGPPFLLTLFTLMAYSPTYESALFLAEEILADRRTPFPLAAVSSLPQLISVAFESHEKLACFCRVLALTLLDVDERGVGADTAGGEFDHDQVSSSLAAMLRRNLDSEAMAVTAANHKLLIEMPGFLERLLAILRPTSQTAAPTGLSLSPGGGGGGGGGAGAGRGGGGGGGEGRRPTRTPTPPRGNKQAGRGGG